MRQTLARIPIDCDQYINVCSGAVLLCEGFLVPARLYKHRPRESPKSRTNTEFVAFPGHSFSLSAMFSTQQNRLLFGSARIRTVCITLGMLAQLCATVALAQDAPEASGAAKCESCGLRRAVVEDTERVFTAPLRWEHADWRTVTREALIVAGTMALLDDPVRDYMQNHRSASTDRIAKTFEPFGAEYVAGVLLGYALVGKLANKPNARKTALDGTVSTLIAAGLIAPALKSITGRSRPRTDQGAFDFHPFGGGASFPSGHTAAAFALATSIAKNNDHLWVKGLSYGVATLVGYARVEHDAHWLSDATASAFIGMAVGKSVSGLNREHRRLQFGSRRDAGDALSLEVSMNF